MTDGIRELRERANLSRVDIARLLGVAESTVQRWDNGHATPLRRHVKALSTALQCAPDELAPGRARQPTGHPLGTGQAPDEPARPTRRRPTNDDLRPEAVLATFNELTAQTDERRRLGPHGN